MLGKYKIKKQINGWRKIDMKYYCIKQHDITDCGAACLATICRQNGYKIGISKIREVAGTDKQGTNAYGVIKAAEQLGFSAKGVKGDKEAFFSEFPLPCIAHVIVDGALLHYVVIHKITKKTVVIADPGEGIVKLTPEEFFGEVHDEGNFQNISGAVSLSFLLRMRHLRKRMRQKEFSPDFFSCSCHRRTYISDFFSISYIYRAWNIGSILFSDINRQCSSGWIKENAHDFINRSDTSQSFQGNP